MKALWRETIGYLLIAVVILVFTFPELDPTFGPGVDWSLAWAYNYIFATDVHLGRDIVFPHGPLGYLMYPVAIGNNLDTAFWAICLIRITFFYSLLRLGSLINPTQWLLHTFIVLVLAQVLPFGVVLPGIVAVTLLIFHFLPEDTSPVRKWFWLLVAIFITALSIHVRAVCGIVSLTFLGSYFLIYLYLKREIKTPLIAGVVFVINLVLFRYFIYGTLAGFFNYYIGLYQLSKESSAATAMYPDNNWKLLGSAGLLLLLYPIITRKRNVWFVYVLFLLPLFASWKHAITREDYYHFRGLFMFLILFFAITTLVSDRVKKRSFIIIGILLILVYRNLSVTENYYEKEHLLFSVNRFADWLNNRPGIRDMAYSRSMQNVAEKQLPEKLKTLIGKSKVDIYPWDFSFIPANDLNWQPRMIPQNYASYSPWLDQQNAEHFASAKAPEFIIWELIENPSGGFITGLDNRYAFNDEPQTIIQLLDKYSKVESTNEVMVLKKTGNDLLGESKIISTQEGAWNTWIPVPAAEDGILRAKFEMHGTLWRSAKNFLYKDEEYTVEYKFETGEIARYRFVPEIAVNGVWVNPLIMQPQNNYLEPLVKEIRFTCTNYKAVKDKFDINWELTEVKQQAAAPDSLAATRLYNKAFALFGKYQAPKERSFNDYEHEQGENIVEGVALSGTHSFLIKPGAFVNGLDIYADSTLHDSVTTLTISARAWMKVEKGAKVNMVITVEDGGNASFWEAVNSEYFIKETDDWGPVFIRRKVNVKRGSHIKAFGWNVGTANAWIDNMEVKIYAE